MARKVEIGKIERSPKTLNYLGKCGNCGENKKLTTTGIPKIGIMGYARYCEDCAVLLKI